MRRDGTPKDGKCHGAERLSAFAFICGMSICVLSPHRRYPRPSPAIHDSREQGGKCQGVRSDPSGLALDRAAASGTVAGVMDGRALIDL